MTSADQLALALHGILAPLVLSGLAAVVTICGVVLYVAMEETTRRLAGLLGAVHTVLWLVVLQQFQRFIDGELISWSLLLITVLIGREFLLDRVPGWELLALWSTTLWGITAIGPSELLRSCQRWREQHDEQEREDREQS